MSIKIKTEKIIDRGEQFIKIKGIEMLKECELPKRYIQGECVFAIKDNSGDTYKVDGKDDEGESLRYWVLIKGDSYTKEQFNERIATIRRCGKRLAAINEQLAIENTDWGGEETIVI